MPEPVDPGERKPLLSLGHSFELDVRAHSAQGGIERVARGASADAAMRTRAETYSLSLGRFWVEQRAALSAAPDAQKSGQQAQLGDLNRALAVAGVDDVTFTKLLDTWETVTSPFGSEYDTDAILSAGQDLRKAVEIIRGVVKGRPLGDAAAVGVVSLLNGVSEQIGSRAEALGEGKVVVPASQENCALQLVKRVTVVAAAGRDPLAGEVERQQGIVDKSQKQLNDLPGQIADATRHLDPAGRQQAEQDLATVRQRLADAATPDTDKAALGKRMQDLTDYLQIQDSWGNRVDSLNHRTTGLQNAVADAGSRGGAAQKRLKAFDLAVGNMVATLSNGSQTSRALLAGATARLYAELDAMLKPGAASAAKSGLQAAFSAAGVDGQLKRLAGQLGQNKYAVDAIADTSSTLAATIQQCIVTTDLLVGAVPQGEAGTAAMRAAARDAYVAVLTAVAGDVQKHFSYLVDKGFFLQ